MERFKFIVENFNYMKSLKELYSEHAYTQSFRWYSGSSINILLCLPYSTSIHPSIHLIFGKLQISVPFVLNTQAAYHLLEASLGLFVCLFVFIP